MYECSAGQVEIQLKNGCEWYRIRLNLVDKDAKTRKDRYRNKYFDTGLLVGGKTGRIKNEMLANEKLAQLIREYTPIGANMLVDKYCEYWLSEMEKDHEIGKITLEGYSYRAGHIIDYFQGKGITLRELSTDDVNDFKSYLYEVERTSTAQRNDKGLSDRSIRDILVLFKQILKYAIDRGHLTGRNVAASVKLPKKNNSKADAPYISEEEIPSFREELERQCTDHPFLVHAYLITLFYGLRREELCGLKWSAIRNGCIHIEHTVTKLKSLVAKDGAKTDAGCRSCAILPETEQIFDEIRQMQEANKKLFGSLYQKSDYVFTFEDGHPMSPDYASKRFKKIVRRSESLDKRLHLHDLRATCVSILIGRGVNYKDVQKWVGHKDIRTTMEIYARTNPQRQKKTAEKMADVLFSD